MSGGKFNELTAERFDLGVKPAEKSAISQHRTSAPRLRAGTKRTREDLESVRVLSLEAENTRLKGELADIAETVNILKV
jgi:hypothetical protein